jgi:uncharacterized RmlC-like cupin family protein
MNQKPRSRGASSLAAALREHGVGRNRREITRIQNAIAAKRDLTKFVKISARSMGVLGVGVEAVNFYNAAKECGCDQK